MIDLCQHLVLSFRHFQLDTFFIRGFRNIQSFINKIHEREREREGYKVEKSVQKYTSHTGSKLKFHAFFSDLV